MFTVCVPMDESQESYYRALGEYDRVLHYAHSLDTAANYRLAERMYWRLHDRMNGTFDAPTARLLHFGLYSAYRAVCDAYNMRDVETRQYYIDRVNRILTAKGIA